MLLASDFLGGPLPTSDFEVRVESLSIGDREFRDVVLSGVYDRHANLHLTCELPTDPQNLLSEINVEVTASWVGSATTSMIITQIQVGIPHSRYRFVPRFQPTSIGTVEDADHVEAVLLNGPSLGNPSFDVEYDGVKIRVDQLPTVDSFRKERRMHKFDYLATHLVKLQVPAGESLSSDKAHSVLAKLADFLSFVRGGHCGLGNVVGTRNGLRAFTRLGFMKLDYFDVETGWFGMGLHHDALALFNLYTALSPNDLSVVRRTVEYYCASNVARDSSPATALIASHAGLETIVPHILSTSAGWSSKQFETPFHNKLRAAAEYAGIVGEILEHSPDLKSKAASLQFDSFRTLAKVRNQVTHPTTAVSYGRMELFEAWQTSQWLCEVFLFFLMGYRGTMYDRRRYTGWRGPSVSVPLPS